MSSMLRVMLETGMKEMSQLSLKSALKPLSTASNSNDTNRALKKYIGKEFEESTEYSITLKHENERCESETLSTNPIATWEYKASKL